ncbi:MAG: hypothetical protein JW749_10340 [Sedimentisphaerales bacterium]|nr:hypothetical protein [Sedimentisphaerales bacterium]
MPRIKEEILFEWIRPREISIQFARFMNKTGIKDLPRSVTIITVILAVLYFIFDYLIPPGVLPKMPKAFFLVWLVGVGILLFFYFIGPWVKVLDRPRYRITNEYVKIIFGDNRKIHKWSNLKGYVLSDSESVPNQKVVYLLTENKPVILQLPKNEMAEQIRKYIAERLPPFQNIPEIHKPVPFTFFEKLALILSTFVYSVGFALYIVFGPRYSFGKKDWMPALLVAVVLFLGPGTICSLSMFGRDFFKHKHLKGCAIFCNLVALHLLLLFFIILELYKLRREAGVW